MRNPWIVPEIVGRTARFTAIAGAVLGATYCVVLFVVFTFVSPPVPPDTLGQPPLPDPASLDAVGLFSLTTSVLLTAFVGAAFGAVAGAIVGAISGGVAGFVTGAITLAAFSPLKYSSVRQFRMVITVFGVVVTALAAYVVGPVVFDMVMSGKIGADAPALWGVKALIPTLLAAAGAWWAGYHVADWYEEDYLDRSSQAVEQITHKGAH